MNKPPTAMLSDPRPVKTPASADKLDRLRAAVREVRDLRAEKASLEERAKAAGKAIYEAEHQKLPDLFDEAGVKSIALQAEGNLPAFEAKVAPYYHANIQAEWPAEKREAAFSWLDKNNHGDLIKTNFVVELGRDDRKKAKKVESFLKKNKIPYSCQPAVAWNTLTAFVREQVERGEVVPLDTLGATIGRAVTIKPSKQEK